MYIIFRHIWVEFHAQTKMKLWVGIRAEIKNEIADLEKFGNENEMRPFHLWNTTYPNLATPHPWAVRPTHKKRVWISPYTLFLFGVFQRPLVLCWWRPNGRPRAYARVNQLCLFSASRPFTTIPASASFFSRLPVIMGVATSRPISAAWL